MNQEQDWKHFTPTFFSTSAVGQPGPAISGRTSPLRDAFAIDELQKMHAIITCQGGDYTAEVYQQLRSAGWQGYWIDAASTLRLANDSVIILDPVNRSVIDSALRAGVKTFVGGNCTVSLMLMALGALFREGLVEWVSSMTYQAASGAGAKVVQELISQNAYLANQVAAFQTTSGSNALELDAFLRSELASPGLPIGEIGAPLAYNVLPFIDKLVDNGQSKEEWKGYVETNKILGLSHQIPVDGICVRVGALRSHSQALTIKLTQDLPLETLESLIASSNDWVRVIPNSKTETINKLTPAAVSGTLDVVVGRLKKMRMGPEYLSAFTAGDQLLWGAAEPLRRFLRILLEHK
jgi:aspartate-semialdehyde dehydrogenase